MINRPKTKILSTWLFAQHKFVIIILCLFGQNHEGVLFDNYLANSFLSVEPNAEISLLRILSRVSKFIQIKPQNQKLKVLYCNTMLVLKNQVNLVSNSHFSRQNNLRTHLLWKNNWFRPVLFEVSFSTKSNVHLYLSNFQHRQQAQYV